MALVVMDTVTGENLGLVDDYKNNSNDSNKKNRDFVQLYRKFIGDIAELGQQDSTALRVLLFLIRHMDGMNAIGVPMHLISDMLNITRQTVSSKIKYLSEHGWITIYKLGKANIYVVNPEVVWTSYDNQKQYCKFNATMLLSGADQWQVYPKQRSQIKYLDPLTISRMAENEFKDTEADTSPTSPQDGQEATA